MVWKAWSPLGGRPRPAELAGPSAAAPPPLMTLSITVYGPGSGEVAISAGHYPSPDGTSVSAADRRRMVHAVAAALTEQVELLAGEPV